MLPLRCLRVLLKPLLQLCIKLYTPRWGIQYGVRRRGQQRSYDTENQTPFITSHHAQPPPTHISTTALTILAGIRIYLSSLAPSLECPS